MFLVLAVQLFLIVMVLLNYFASVETFYHKGGIMSTFMLQNVKTFPLPQFLTTE